MSSRELPLLSEGDVAAVGTCGVQVWLLLHPMLLDGVLGMHCTCCLLHAWRGLATLAPIHLACNSTGSAALAEAVQEHPG